MRTTETVPATEATVTDVLAYLDEPFTEFGGGVAHGRYTLWLGSGISLSRVDGLKQLLLRAIRKLQQLSHPDDIDCRYNKALVKFIRASCLPPARLSMLNMHADPESWERDIRDDVLAGLVANYSLALDVRVAGELPDYLLWEAIDVRSTYALEALAPDGEHLAIALLAAEGLAPELLTANWDSLIEKSFTLLGYEPGEISQICVTADDLRGVSTGSRLIKFHGCAVSATKDEATHRGMLIHQASQIINYRNNAAYSAVRVELVSQATTRPTLMVGLSAQDSDILDVFAEAGANRKAPFPSDPPAYVFAEDELGVNQGTVLRSVYGDTFDDRAEEIESTSVIRAYAKPLLGALLLDGWTRKLRWLADQASPSVSTEVSADLGTGLNSIRDRAGEWLEDASADRVLLLARYIGGSMRLLRSGRRANNQDGYKYWPISRHSLAGMKTDEELLVGGMPELAAGLGLLGLGLRDGLWSCEVIENEEGVLVRPAESLRVSKVLFASSPRAALQMEIGGVINDGDTTTVVLHSQPVPERRARTPRVAPGRTGSSGLRHVSIEDMLAEATSTDELRRRFREEAVL